MSFRPPAGPQVGARLGALDATDLLLVLILSLGGVRLLGLVVGAALGSAVELPDQAAEPAPTLLITLFALQCVILVSALHLVAIRGKGLSWSDLGLARPQGPWLRRAVVAAIAAFPLVYFVNALVAGMLGDVPENPQLQAIAPAAVSWGSTIGMLLTLGVAVPIAEELIFRGLLYGWLRHRFGLLPAMVFSALCFSLLHGIVWLTPALAMLGLLLAWIYERSGTLWAPIVTHGLFNVLSTLLLYSALNSGVLQS